MPLRIKIHCQKPSTSLELDFSAPNVHEIIFLNLSVYASSATFHLERLGLYCTCLYTGFARWGCNAQSLLLPRITACHSYFFWIPLEAVQEQWCHWHQHCLKERDHASLTPDKVSGPTLWKPGMNTKCWQKLHSTKGSFSPFCHIVLLFWDSTNHLLLQYWSPTCRLIQLTEHSQHLIFYSFFKTSNEISLRYSLFTTGFQ